MVEEQRCRDLMEQVHGDWDRERVVEWGFARPDRLRQVACHIMVTARRWRRRSIPRCGGVRDGGLAVASGAVVVVSGVVVVVAVVAVAVAADGGGRNRK